MSKVILDTNVLMSGIFFGGGPACILESCYSGEFKLILTKLIYKEYLRVHSELLNKYRTLDDFGILEFILNNATFVTQKKLPEQICNDKDDDKFIACALVSDAILISGDKALLQCNGYKGISILSPRQFLSR